MCVIFSIKKSDIVILNIVILVFEAVFLLNFNIIYVFLIFQAKLPDGFNNKTFHIKCHNTTFFEVSNKSHFFPKLTFITFYFLCVFELSQM